MPDTGKRFSHLYMERGAPLPDSARCRNRLAQYLADFGYDLCHEMADFMVRELGVPIPGLGTARVVQFFGSAAVHDVLDGLTIVFAYFWSRESNNRGTAHRWRGFVERVFREENVAYVVDAQCGVHPLVDSEFIRNITSAIRGLGTPRYEAARMAFEAAEAKLKQTKPDTKGAIRDMFEATETLTKLISGTGKALTDGFVKSELEPRVQRLYSGDAVAAMVGARLSQSFADWVQAAHPYRHGHETEDPVEPPQELAVLLVSQGASFIRWLVDLDQEVNKGAA